MIELPKVEIRTSTPEAARYLAGAVRAGYNPPGVPAVLEESADMIDRLRNALARIRDHYDDTDLAAKHMAAIARAALSEPQADSELPETAGRNADRSGDGQSDTADHLIKHPATFTYDREAHAYYFSPMARTDPPYLKQVFVEAIIDVASDGTLAGVEIFDAGAPLPPVR